MKNLFLLCAFVALAFVSLSFVKKPARSATAALSVSKSLAFPVAGKKSNIGSYWGASRDGGRRSHKGIDIFARKGTPVVAIADGVIVSRQNTAVGGKVLWLKSAKHKWTAYYAHLDKQLVKQGQRVRKGQVIGTVGKTGNARTTPPHLHFGMATHKGWVNPLPYVKNSPKVLIKPAAKKKTVSAKKRSTRSKR